MRNDLIKYAKRFDAQTLRERALVGFSVLAVLIFLWWSYYADPKMVEINAKNTENERISREIATTRAQVSLIRQRIAAGVHLEKEDRLAQLQKELDRVEEQLRVKTVELIDPEKMFQLMNELIYRDSNLTLLGLKRRDVRPAIPVSEDDPDAKDPGIYRHVLEIEFAGKYLDILRYMQSLEDLDWKLLWDEIEIESREHPKMTVKVVISTLSTRKEWVGI